MAKSVNIPESTVHRLQGQMLEELRCRNLGVRAGHEWVRDHAKYPALVRLERLANDLDHGADICDCNLPDMIGILVEPDCGPDDVSQFWKDIAGEEFQIGR